jgi:hypothetical protein
MNPNEILDALARMPEGQFALVVSKFCVPAEFILGALAAQGTRAVELVRYLEGGARLIELAKMLRRDVAPEAHPSPPTCRLEGSR